MESTISFMLKFVMFFFFSKKKRKTGPRNTRNGSKCALALSYSSAPTRYLTKTYIYCCMIQYSTGLHRLTLPWVVFHTPVVIIQPFTRLGRHTYSQRRCCTKAADTPLVQAELVRGTASMLQPRAAALRQQAMQTVSLYTKKIADVHHSRSPFLHRCLTPEHR